MSLGLLAVALLVCPAGAVRFPLFFRLCAESPLFVLGLLLALVVTTVVAAEQDDAVDTSSSHSGTGGGGAVDCMLLLVLAALLLLLFEEVTGKQAMSPEVDSEAMLPNGSSLRDVTYRLRASNGVTTRLRFGKKMK